MYLEYQPSLFDNDIEALRRENLELRRSLDKLRKAMWARQNELAKISLDVHTRLEIMENYICRGKL